VFWTGEQEEWKDGERGNSFHGRDCIESAPRGKPRRFVVSPHRAGKEAHGMDDIDREGNGGDDDEQFEQMIVENSILLHSIAALLVRKGVIKQEEIDAEMDKLYDEMEKFDGE
jgi:hypothetical protein